jgi:hypothetical protein
VSPAIGSLAIILRGWHVMLFGSYHASVTIPREYPSMRAMTETEILISRWNDLARMQATLATGSLPVRDHERMMEDFNRLRYELDPYRSAANDLRILGNISLQMATMVPLARNMSPLSSYAPRLSSGIYASGAPTRISPMRNPEYAREPNNLGPTGSYAPEVVTPGIRVLVGHHINDLGQSEPWRAHYDRLGQIIARTDYTLGNPRHDIPPIHYHTYRWEYPISYPIPVLNHVPGEYNP